MERKELNFRKQQQDKALKANLEKKQQKKEDSGEYQEYYYYLDPEKKSVQILPDNISSFVKKNFPNLSKDKKISQEADPNNAWDSNFENIDTEPTVEYFNLNLSEDKNPEIETKELKTNVNTGKFKNITNILGKAAVIAGLGIASQSLHGQENNNSSKADTPTFSFNTANDKNKKESIKSIPGQPAIDNKEYYNAEDIYRAGPLNSLAYKNYVSGNFKYHELSESFKGMGSSFWRKRVSEGLDKKLPLRKGERVESLNSDHLLIVDFSIKDGEKYDRAVIVKKGTKIVLDSDNHIVAIAECMNPIFKFKILCTPCMNINGKTYLKTQQGYEEAAKDNRTTVEKLKASLKLVKNN